MAIPMSAMIRYDVHYDYLFKMLLVGESAVGKSSLVIRFAEDRWVDQFISTIGVDFRIRSLELDSKNCKLQIWDTAGQERFRTITTSYYRGADGVMLVFDITDRDSFDNLGKWLDEISHHAKRSVRKILVGNKADLANKRCVTAEEAREFAELHGMVYVEASAKDSRGVSEAFVEMARGIKADIDKDPAYRDCDWGKCAIGGGRDLHALPKGVKVDDPGCCIVS